jgi:hypothetical protein
MITENSSKMTIKITTISTGHKKLYDEYSNESNVVDMCFANTIIMTIIIIFPITIDLPYISASSSFTSAVSSVNTTSVR